MVLIAVMLICLVATGYFAHFILHRNAKNEVIQYASLMLEMAQAVRGYTVGEIRPLIKDKMIHEFLPQSVPAYAATQSFNKLRQKHPEYSYKEATLNPTNLRDRATDWEVDVIQDFAKDENKKQIIGVRKTPTGTSLFLSQPIRITNPACLTCHSEPAKAPETMTVKYGNSNGFGWKLNEIVGAQIVTVPMALPIKMANQIFIIFMAFVLAIFAFIIIVLNLMLRFIVVKPITEITIMAGKVSMGRMDTPEVLFNSKDEISLLATSFNRMRRSLQKAIKMLEK